MKLQTCPNCGAGGFTVYEIKDGKCIFCQETDLEDVYSEGGECDKKTAKDYENEQKGETKC